jgi:hypothetical protein
MTRAHKSPSVHGEYASTKIVGNTVSDEKDQECQGRTDPTPARISGPLVNPSGSTI